MPELRKKLVQKYNWFKVKRKNYDENRENDENREENIKKKRNTEKKEVLKEDEMPKSILFVQDTEDSMLAKEIRKVIQELKPWTRLNIKVIERAGERLEDMLHKSNCWENSDCGRENCKICETSVKDESIPFKNCTRRSILYKTLCESCRKRNVSKLGEKIEGENRFSKRKFEELIEKEDYVYFGETSRSSNERGTEH